MFVHHAFDVIIVLLLLFIAAIFSAIETAFTAYQISRVHKIKNQEKVKMVSFLIKNKDVVISTFLILYSITSTLATIIATGFFIEIYGNYIGTIVSGLVMTILIVIFAEVIPKGIAVSRNEVVVLYTYTFAFYMVQIFKPLNYILSFCLKLFCKIFNINLNYYISPADEVRNIIYHHHSEGYVYKEDKDMLDGVLELTNITVEDVMIHRSQVFSLDINLKPEELIKKALSSNFSNIPIWQNNKENIIGVLNIKQLCKNLFIENNNGFTNINLIKFIKDPYFIPCSILLNNQLKEFKIRDDYIAFIIDEYGDIQGIVTIKDILEEITGFIKDNTNNQKIIKKNDNLFIIDGSVTIRDINRELEWQLPEEANTIAGFIIEKCGYVPEQNQIIEITDLEKFILKITIRKKNNNKIKTLEIKVINNQLNN
ncbi:MAG: CNNM domain-containing protein [Rickettsiales bacterium]